jgi:hypothetical protein
VSFTIDSYTVLGREPTPGLGSWDRRESARRSVTATALRHGEEEGSGRIDAESRFPRFVGLTKGTPGDGVSLFVIGALGHAPAETSSSRESDTVPAAA